MKQLERWSGIIVFEWSKQHKRKAWSFTGVSYSQGWSIPEAKGKLQIACFVQKPIHIQQFNNSPKHISAFSCEVEKSDIYKAKVNIGQFFLNFFIQIYFNKKIEIDMCIL